MKSKIKRGKNFNGLCRYILRRSAQPDLIGGNLIGTTPAELSREFQQVAALRPEIEKPVWHSSLALPKGDKLSDQQWNQIVTDYLHGLGFDTNTTPFMVVRHKNTQSDHVHIAASRVNLSGGLYLGRNEHLIATRICQELELRHGLTITPGPDHKAPAKALKTTEKAMQQRTGKVPPRRLLQLSIDKVFKDNGNLTIDEFIKKLAQVGIIARPNLSKSGKMSGFSFEINGIAFKASQLGKAYGWQTLEKRLQGPQQVKPQSTILPVPQRPVREAVWPLAGPVATPTHAAAVAETAATEVAALLDDKDVKKIVNLIGDLAKGGIGLPVPKVSIPQTKVSDVKQLPVPKPPFVPIRNEADKAQVTDNKAEIKRLSSELWLAKMKTKRRQGIISRIVNWRRQQILTKEIEQLKRRNAELRAKAEARIMAPSAPTTKAEYDQLVTDFCKLQVSKDTKLQQLNANQKAFELAFQQTTIRLASLQNRKAELLNAGAEQGWGPNTPPPPIWQPLQRKAHATWISNFNNISGQLSKLQTLEIQQKQAVEQANAWARERTQEAWSAARREVEARPQMVDFIKQNKLIKSKKQVKQRGSQGLSL